MTMEAMLRRRIGGYHQFGHMHPKGRSDDEIMIQANKRVLQFNCWFYKLLHIVASQLTA